MTEFAAAISLRDRLDLVADTLNEAAAIRFTRSAECEDVTQELSFAQFGDQVRRRAGALLSAGIMPGAVVATMMPLSAYSYATLTGILTVGTATPLNYFLESEALIDLIRQVKATALVATANADDDPNFSQKLKEIQEKCPLLDILIFGQDDEVPIGRNLEQFLPPEGSGWPDGLPANLDRPVMLMSTGGTTGRPKIVPHTERMYLALFESCAHAQGTLRGEIVTSAMPLFHTSGTLNSGMVPLMAGATLIIPTSRGFRDPRLAELYWDIVRRNGITIGTAVPTALAALAANLPAMPVPSLKYILTGGAPLAEATADRVRQNTGAEIVNGWGMTETCGFSVLNPLHGPRQGTVGTVFPDVEIQIRMKDADGELTVVAAPDTIGEIVARGSIVITRYHSDTVGSFTPDGWLRTGDLGRMDEEGFLSITGRVKDIIIRGGHNIDPSTIEDPTYEHPDVQLAAAIGLPDRYAGELPMLFVQLKAAATVTEDELLEYIRPKIRERAAVPKRVCIVDALPLSGPGKISKLLLRRLAIRMAFQETADAILGSGAISVEAAETNNGTTAILTATSGHIAPERAKQLNDKLSEFAVPFEWR